MKRAAARKTLKGRNVSASALNEIEQLLGDASRDRQYLIEHLHRIQDRFDHLSAAHLAALARLMNLAQAEVYEVASFYHHFDIVKEGESAPAAVTVRVCETLSCALSGSHELLERCRQQLGAQVRVIAAPCIGRCEVAPAVCVGQNAFGHATPEAIARVIERGETRATAPEYLDYDAYVATGGYQRLTACLQGTFEAESVIAELENSGLRGLGGAGFQTGRKWRIVRNEPAPRLMAVNIDEGEPGTFKDRWYLERDPHRFLEGMLIAAWAVGIDTIYLYLRDEYHQCRQLLSAELARLRAAPPAGFTATRVLPNIELRRGAGAYVCGEESAMIESIEGKRGMPRLRPPYVAQVGLFGRPTLAHNFETLYWVREILDRGADWFAAQGRHGRTGLRSFSLSGRIKTPGVHLAPAGITVRELIAEFGGGMQDGHEFYAYLPGGASGGILPARLGDVPLDFDTLQTHDCFIGSAAVIILSQHDRARDAASNLMQFFAHESCGQCTPCRVGTEKSLALMQQPVWNNALLQDLSQVMMDASICGLGQAAPNPIRSVLSHFRAEVEPMK
jgi:formate dehydrogenase beta subunit